MRIGRRGNLHPEDGAVLAIVALLLFVIFGMVVLTVDVGGMLSQRRQMVTAADAAALAAAQECAQTGASASSASGIADQYATSNVAGASRTNFEIGPNGDECGVSTSGRVTVGYQSSKDLFFAPILGFPNEIDVPSGASAIWGPAAQGNPIPVMISQDWLDSVCQIPDQPPGEPIECLWDNKALASSSWGGLDLNAWNVDENHHCTNQGGAAVQKGWMSQGGIDEQLSVNDSPPTWVCATDGLREDVVKTLDDYAKANPENILHMPISRPPPLMKNPNQFDKYNIVGLLAVRVIEAGKVSPSPSINGECEARFLGPVGSGQEMFLDDLVETCNQPYQAPFSSIQFLQVRQLNPQGEPQGGNQATWSFSGVDDRMFTWTGDALDDGLYLRFRFTQPGEPNCGTQTTSDTSAYCITFQYMGVQFAPGGVADCSGSDCVGNIRAVQLIE